MQDSETESLLDASAAGDLRRAREILSRRANAVDINGCDDLGDTPLILAARNGHFELVQLLLEKGADVEATNSSNDTALISASERPDNAAVLNLLLDHGARINHKNELGRTALIEAASIGCLQNCVLLVQQNADPNFITSEEESALTFAIVYEHPEVVKVLLDAGADVNWKNTQGWTPLTYAVYSHNVEIVRLLLDAGADQNNVDASGESALDHANRNGLEAIARLLRDK